MNNRKNDVQYRPYFWFSLPIAILLSVIWDLYPLPNAENRLQQLPVSGPSFSSRNISFTPSEEALLGKAKVRHRCYQFEGHNVFVTLIDGTENRHSVHDPSYCFRGAGWVVVRQEATPIPRGYAKRLNVQRKTEMMGAVYWFSDGRQRHSSFPLYWWQTTLRRITLGHSGPEPVLVVLQSNDPQADWPKLLPKMIAALSPSL